MYLDVVLKFVLRFAYNEKLTWIYFHKAYGIFSGNRTQVSQIFENDIEYKNTLEK